MTLHKRMASSDWYVENTTVILSGELLAGELVPLLEELISCSNRVPLSLSEEATSRIFSRSEKNVADMVCWDRDIMVRIVYPKDVKFAMGKQSNVQ